MRHSWEVLRCCRRASWGAWRHMQVEEPAQSKNQTTPDPIHLLATRAWMIPRENCPSGSNKPMQLWEIVIYFRLKLTHLWDGSLGSITPKINKRHLFEHRPECCEDPAMLKSMLTGSVLTGEGESFNWISEHHLSKEDVFCKHLPGVCSSDQFGGPTFLPSRDCSDCTSETFLHLTAPSY